MNATSTSSRYHVFIRSRKNFRSMARFWVVLICKICYIAHYLRYKNKVCSRQLSFYWCRYYTQKFFCLVVVGIDYIPVMLKEKANDGWARENEINGQG